MFVVSSCTRRAAAVGLRRGAAGALRRRVVEDAERVVGVQPGVVLIHEVSRPAAGQVVKIVRNAAERPEDLAFAGDTHDGRGMPARDDVISIAVHVDAVDVEVIERRLWRRAVVIAREGPDTVAQGDVLHGAPFEYQLSRGNVDFLKHRVQCPALLRAANRC